MTAVISLKTPSEKLHICKIYDPISFDQFCQIISQGGYMETDAILSSTITHGVCVLCEQERENIEKLTKGDWKTCTFDELSNITGIRRDVLITMRRFNPKQFMSPGFILDMREKGLDICLVKDHNDQFAFMVRKMET